MVYRATKPDRFFRKKSRKITPATWLYLTKPKAFDHLGDDEYVVLVRQRLEARQWEIAAEQDEEDKDVLGVEVVLGQDPFDSPKRSVPGRNLGPKVIERDEALKIHLFAAHQAFV